MEELIREWLEQFGAKVGQVEKSEGTPFEFKLEFSWYGTTMSMIFFKKDVKYHSAIRRIAIVSRVKPEEPYQKKFRAMTDAEYSDFDHRLMYLTLPFAGGCGISQMGRDVVFQSDVNLGYISESELTPSMICDYVCKVSSARAMFINFLRRELGEPSEIQAEMGKAKE
jgi:hypothetical protein